MEESVIKVECLYLGSVIHDKVGYSDGERRQERVSSACDGCTRAYIPSVGALVPPVISRGVGRCTKRTFCAKCVLEDIFNLSLGGIIVSENHTLYNQ